MFSHNPPRKEDATQTLQLANQTGLCCCKERPCKSTSCALSRPSVPTNSSGIQLQGPLHPVEGKTLGLIQVAQALESEQS